MKWEIIERNKYDPYMAKVRIYANSVEELQKMDWEAMEREIGGKLGGVMYFSGNPPYLEGDVVFGIYWVKDYEAYVNVWNAQFNIVICGKGSGNRPCIVVEELDISEDIIKELEKEAEKSINERGAINISGMYPLTGRMREILEKPEILAKIGDALKRR